MTRDAPALRVMRVDLRKGLWVERSPPPGVSHSFKTYEIYEICEIDTLSSVAAFALFAVLQANQRV